MDINIVLWLIQNMEKIIKEGVVITDVICEPEAHPHYESRIVNKIYYDEKIVYESGYSGSPSAWNYYSNNKEGHEFEMTLEQIVNCIINDIDEAKNLMNDEKYEVYYNKEIQWVE